MLWAGDPSGAVVQIQVEDCKGIPRHIPEPPRRDPVRLPDARRRNGGAAEEGKGIRMGLYEFERCCLYVQGYTRRAVLARDAEDFIRSVGVRFFLGLRLPK